MGKKQDAESSEQSKQAVNSPGRATRAGVAAKAAAAQAVNSTPKPIEEPKKEVDNKVEEEEEEDEVVTYCKVCKIECHTENGYFSHTSGMAHMMKAAAVGDVEKTDEDTNPDKETGDIEKAFELVNKDVILTALISKGITVKGMKTTGP